MKAPKKLYLRKRCKLPYDVVQNEWYERPPISIYGNIEYTRTDAFFDKATIWFNNNLGHDECGVIAYQFDTEEEMLKDFIEYMKGE